MTSRAAAPRLVYLRDLISELVMRDLKIRYVRSWLGILWGMVTPLVQAMVFVFLFKSVLRLDAHPQFASLVFVAVLAWAWFQNGLISAAGAITDNRDLVKRPGFPLAILPVVSIGVNFIHFGLAIPVLCFVAFALDGLKPHAALAFFPFIAAAQYLLLLGPSYMIAALQVRYRAVSHMVGIALMVGFFLTPIFY